MVYKHNEWNILSLKIMSRFFCCYNIPAIHQISNGYNTTYKAYPN